MSNVPGRETFETMYARKPPWDIGRPQRAFVEVADRVTGEVLDAGCGTGENALYFAQRGHPVLGIDYLEGPVQEARRKAQDRGLNAEFVTIDALTLEQLDRQFDSVIDSGLFHVFSDEDRARYVAGLTHVTRPGGRLFLLCFSDEEPGTQGPRRVSQGEIRDAVCGRLGGGRDPARAVRGPAGSGGRLVQRGRPQGVVLGGPAGVLKVSVGEPRDSRFIVLQQPSLRTFDQKEVVGRTSDVVPPNFFNFFGVVVLVVKVGI